MEDNSKIIFLICQQKHVVTPHLNRLSKTVLMMGHTMFLWKNTCMDNYTKIIPVAPSYVFVLVVVLLFYVHGKHLRSCQDSQLT